ncbi:MAG: pilus assembly protein [Alphaproteobacteria bacterium]|nr:pilus assembly protein [Alphaproteobacteria bacterium]MDE2111335.1 pilus assembly protein [Alphaproteobacteria bacterium]MDE2495612.1 pilus assembly protein [Alphaproteobacteria bacterium]
MARRHPHGGFLRHDGGAAALEFALVASAFFALVTGIAYIVIMLFNNLSLDWAVEHAARLAAINKSVTQTQIASAVNDYLTSVNLPTATVQYSVTTVNNVQTASISASYQQSYTVPFVSTFDITFSSSADVPQGS